MGVQNRKVAELCSNYARLNAKRVTLDRRIQCEVKMHPADQDDGQDQSSTSGPNESLAEDAGCSSSGQVSPEQGISDDLKLGNDVDMLWIKLDDVVAQQSNVTAALIDTPAADVPDLRLKAAVLASLLQAINLRENDLALNLSGSVVRDIAALFAYC